MTHAEIIQRAVRLEKTDRVPFSLLSAGTWAINRKDCGLEKALTLDAATIAQWLYEGYTLADSAISWTGSGYNNVVIKALGGKIKWRRKGTPDVEDALFTSADDIAAARPAVIADDPDIRKIYDTTAELVKLENRQRLVGGITWGPFTIAGLLFGADSLMRLIIKDKTTLDKLLRFSSELCLTYLQGYIDNGARVLYIADPSASGDMISRKHFEIAALPYIKEIFQRLSRQYGKDLILVLHICGDICDRLDLVADSGVDMISLDYKVPLSKAKTAFTGKISFAGNLDPVGIVQNGTEESIKNAVIQGIEDSGGLQENNGYIVMPGCDIPPNSPLENVQLISKTVNEYR